MQKERYIVTVKINYSYFKARLLYVLQTPAFIFLFILYCLQCLECQKGIIRMNAGIRTTLADAILYQFNTYSFVHLMFIPIFICTLYQFVRMGKFNEFILCRYNGRTQLVFEMEKEVILFTGLYRCIEIVVTSIIFIAAKYSLQGTTQGNGLTGGVPPVRFSM